MASDPARRSYNSIKKQFSASQGALTGVQPSGSLASLAAAEPLAETDGATSTQGNPEAGDRHCERQGPRFQTSNPHGKGGEG